MCFAKIFYLRTEQILKRPIFKFHKNNIFQLCCKDKTGSYLVRYNVFKVESTNQAGINRRKDTKIVFIFNFSGFAESL